MKPNEFQNRKLNLNKQTIQKLDQNKLVNIFAGDADNIGLSATLTVTGSGVSIGLNNVCNPILNTDISVMS
jgi:hypothetical protein